MASGNQVKRERVQIRIDSRSKLILERAASYMHKSISEFVLANSLTAAERVIEEHEKITLFDADWEVFHDALENPPKPNAKLKKAFREYRKSKN